MLISYRGAAEKYRFLFYKIRLHLDYPFSALVWAVVNLARYFMSLFGLTGPIGFSSIVDNTLSPNIDLPPVEELRVTAPSTADDVYGPPTLEEWNKSQDAYNSANYYEDYLSMLKKASEMGIFATASDSHRESQIDREFQALEAQKERDWYEQLSGSAYQRQVKDLEAAGLNPILGWSHVGSGSASAHAAVPGGSTSMIRAEAPNLADYLNAGSNVVSSASKLLQGIASLLRL